MAGNVLFRDSDGLSAIANCESTSRAADLVFVHGLGGGSCSTAEIRFEGRVTGDSIDLIVQDGSGHARLSARRKAN